jgi:hypothetical protein
MSQFHFVGSLHRNIVILGIFLHKSRFNERLPDGRPANEGRLTTLVKKVHFHLNDNKTIREWPPWLSWCAPNAVARR